ncbi:RNI-like protein [Fragilariopsis cylindrus CCMP1102]|uniref:RNI-like protein n=1 Tax=Fragilariopsis cylindrus CCMP1102 TaxID=635003 RepID=A0A1E7ET88_9STRA|nr:RNI-like protein [Fragilariopsis cylindrus CCMP1102]|eukprot:OEU09079.1 RNI-like protein [Fragilariopsis cylindrus CCMP1102]
MISNLSSRFLGRGGNNNNNENSYPNNGIRRNGSRPVESVEPSPPPLTGDSKSKKKKSTQIFINGSSTAKRDIKLGTNDITKTSIYGKNVIIDHKIAIKLLELIRGDNRSWESIAVDILRQKKVRWESIKLDNCCSYDHNEQDNHQDLQQQQQQQGSGSASASTINYFELILSNIINIDNCTHLHLSNMKSYTISTSFALSSIIFSKHLCKLQLDFITDLSYHIPLLSQSISKNTSVTSLITSRCGLNDNHLGILLGSLPKQLEELRIFGNKCRSNGLHSLTNHIIGVEKDSKKRKDKKSKKKDKKSKKSTCKLKIIDLSYQHVNTSIGEEFDLLLFSKALSNNKTIKILDLDNTSINDLQLSYLIDSLCKNKTLEELTVNHNKITDAGVALLGTKFSDIKGLKKISMYSNIFDTT